MKKDIAGTMSFVDMKRITSVEQLTKSLTCCIYFVQRPLLLPRYSLFQNCRKTTAQTDTLQSRALVSGGIRNSNTCKRR